MKREDLFEAFEGIDEKRLEASEKIIKKSTWRRWCSLAACLAVLIAAATSSPQVFPRTYGKLETAPQDGTGAGASGGPAEGASGGSGAGASGGSAAGVSGSSAAGVSGESAAAKLTETPPPSSFSAEAPGTTEEGAGRTADAASNGPGTSMDIVSGEESEVSAGTALGKGPGAGAEKTAGEISGEDTGMASGKASSTAQDGPSGSSSGRLSGSSAEHAPAAGNDNGTLQGISENGNGFWMNGAEYFPVTYEQRQRLGLLADTATASDLGEIVGVIEDSADDELKGCTVYRFAGYPDNDALCIVDKNGKFEIYCSDNLVLSDEMGQNGTDGLEEGRTD